MLREQFQSNFNPIQRWSFQQKSAKWSQLKQLLGKESAEIVNQPIEANNDLDRIVSRIRDASSYDK